MFYLLNNWPYDLNCLDRQRLLHNARSTNECRLCNRFSFRLQSQVFSSLISRLSDYKRLLGYEVVVTYSSAPSKWLVKSSKSFQCHMWIFEYSPARRPRCRQSALISLIKCLSKAQSPFFCHFALTKPVWIPLETSLSDFGTCQMTRLKVIIKSSKISSSFSVYFPKKKIIFFLRIRPRTLRFELPAKTL